ncbi:MAG: AAA family ATPase, partial [Planctomycetota bacterium]|nr:AAA family ATPase [Planctomycetota bacterium]
TRTVRDAFLHDKNQNTWGFTRNYINELTKILPRREKVPILHLAVWIFKERAWDEQSTRNDVVKAFLEEFHISADESRKLFEISFDSHVAERDAFQSLPVRWHEILEDHSRPPDVQPEQSGILYYLEVSGVDPVNPMIFKPARRLNIVTGDNGLGKTFLLDLSWWALTQSWAELPAQPKNVGAKKKASIKFSVSGGSSNRPVTVRFSPKELRWQEPKEVPSISGLVVYARVDGSFAVWDPINTVLSERFARKNTEVLFSRQAVWDGKEGQIEGLIRDWVRWQERRDKYPEFSTFEKVLYRLLPADVGPIRIGEPRRIVGQVKEIPTLIHPYGEVPILFESAGFKRIATLAYLIVWAWQEHKIQAKQADRKEERQMVILIDEAEAHLHPKWQRKILPAILSIGEELSSELSIQLIVATHSPLVLASSEPVFDSEIDKLFHLDIDSRGLVKFDELPYELRGTIDSWLSSPVFGLKYPGSDARSLAIERAVRLQESEDITREQVEEVTNDLRNALPSEDTFWVRWVLFAEQHGIQV